MNLDTEPTFATISNHTYFNFKPINMKRNLLIVCLMAITSFAMAQTGTIKGRVLDPDTNESLIGANAVISGTSKGATTDVDGYFTIENVEAGTVTINISFIGYESVDKTVSVKAGQTTDLGDVSLSAGSIGLKEVEVIASVAIDRKTPVAVSTVKGTQISEKLGNQEFPEILKFTPSVYTTKAGGGFGDARINVRGFDQRNTAVMINGIPVNDMENGWVYWSNWAGLSDVTSTMQVQRGLSASKLAVSSVGGTINIITNAAEMKKGGKVSASIGNDGYQKYGLVLSTGLSESGWAFTLQGTHTRGNGYADGTMFRGYSYFASLAKQMGDHSLNFTVLGAPQWHNQREYGSFDGVNIATVEQEGYRYNPQWGTLDGDEFSWRKNFYHKPKAFLNWYWNISEKTELATSAYYSIGRGGGTGDLGRINGAFRTSSQFKDNSDSDGPVRWDDIKAWNTGGTVSDFGADQIPWSGPGVTTEDPSYSGPFAGQHVAESWRNGMILRSSMNEHNWMGILSNLTTDLSDNLRLIAGIDGRYYKGKHYRRVEDLLGLDAYYDDDNINIPDHYVTDEGRADGNEIDYYNDGIVSWLGLFAQLEYSVNNLSAFVSFSGSNQGFKRVDYFNYLDSDPEQTTDWQNFLGGTVKAGLNYNINEQHNVFVNGGYFSQQPIFDNVFVNFVNDVNPDVKNQNVVGLEAGYGFRSRFFKANLNLYSTQWYNRQISRGVDVNGTDGYANFPNIGQLHQGIEIDLAYAPIAKLNITGMASFGNWRYTKDFSATIYDDSQNVLGTLDLFMKDVKIGDAAQTTIGLGAEYEIIKGLGITVDYYLADNLYADFDVANDASFLTPGNQAWKLPSYSTVDASVSYGFKVGSLDFKWRFRMNNILDNNYIAESSTNRLYNSTDPNDKEYGTNGSINNIVYYGFGRTWNTSLSVKF